MSVAPPRDLHRWLSQFTLADFLRPHVAEVFAALPAAVREDLCSDPAFHLCDYEPGGPILRVPMASPGRGRPGRRVVLKRKRRHPPPAVFRWLIVHQLAPTAFREAG